MNALKAYKYERARHFEPFLAQLVEEWLQRAPVGGTWTALIPAPISRRRRRERGFNQATELAKSAQKVLQIPIWDNILQRRHTRPQAGLDRLERSQNLRGALAVNPRGVDPIGGAFLLFDDVLTTGATLNACAHALLEAGAHRVGALTLLRER